MSFFKRAGYPKKYFLLDIIAIPIALISVLKLAGNTDVLPEPLLFENYEWYCVSIVIVLIAPGYIFSITKQKDQISDGG